MSGGHYDYGYRKLNDLAEQIRADALDTESVDLPADIRIHMTFISNAIEDLANAAHDIEWMMSCDYGFDTLRDRCVSWRLSDAARRSVGTVLRNT